MNAAPDTPELCAAIRQCRHCQRTSTCVAAFTQVYSFRGPEFLCPHCAQRRSERDTYKTWAWASAALLLIPAAAWMGILPRNLWMTMGWRGVTLAENNLAWANFVIDDPAQDAESLERTARSMAMLPWQAPVVITRCSVLASRGTPGSERLAEARALLLRVGELEMSKAARIGVEIVEGLIAAANCQGAEARRRLEAARRLGDPGLAGRVLEARLPSN